MNKILIIDIETAGFLNAGGSIVEIGIVSLDLDNGEIKEIFNSLLKEDLLSEKHFRSPYNWIFRNSNLTPEELKNAPAAAVVLKKVQDIINQYPLGCTAFNSKFDFDYLRDRGIKINKTLPCLMGLSMNVCKIKRAGGGYKWPNVEEAYKHFFPESNYNESHRGADDAFHEAQIAYKLYQEKVLIVEKPKEEEAHGLRDYQKRSIDMLHDYLKNSDGNPCLVLPTGSGKSHIISHFCENAIKSWPGTKILMLTHQRELIAQNAEKILIPWPGAPLGIYSAGLKKKEIDYITFAGIQSIRGHSDELGHIDIILIDECHLVSHKDEGNYRKLINELKEINPLVRVVGLTASPWRLGHGLITDGDALFDDLIEPVTIEELQKKGYLSDLKSKKTKQQLSTEGVHKRCGEFIEKELQAAVDKDDINKHAVEEMIKWAQTENREHWLIFCTGVDHAEHIKNELNNSGISCETLSSRNTLAQRDDILSRFKAGKIKALTNCAVLTTGFDYPDIDMIVFLRPTMSPVLYCQMAGRGLRLKTHTTFCRVLDFAGVISTHGPITDITPPRKRGENGGEAPVKSCPECDELIHASIMKCPECGYEFPPAEKKPYTFHNDDIMGRQKEKEMMVSKWEWRVQNSRTSGKPMLVTTYYGNLTDPPIREYLCIFHEGYAGQKGMALLKDITLGAGLKCEEWPEDWNEFLDKVNALEAPGTVKYVTEGKFNRVTDRIFIPF